MEVSKGLVLNNSLGLYWLRHGFFTKKSQLILDFSLILRSFCRRKIQSG